VDIEEREQLDALEKRVDPSVQIIKENHIERKGTNR
jgi:hypothetical protein